MNDGIRRRRRLQPNETDFLIKVFEQYPRPNSAMRELLAHRLGMSSRGVQIWFQNRRAKVKRDLIESGKAMLLFAPTCPTISSNHMAISNGGHYGNNNGPLFNDLVFSSPSEVIMSSPPSSTSPPLLTTTPATNNNKNIATMNSIQSSGPFIKELEEALMRGTTSTTSSTTSTMESCPEFTVPSAEQLEKLMKEMIKVQNTSSFVSDYQDFLK